MQQVDLFITIFAKEIYIRRGLCIDALEHQHYTTIIDGLGSKMVLRVIDHNRNFVMQHGSRFMTNFTKISTPSGIFVLVIQGVLLGTIL